MQNQSIVILADSFYPNTTMSGNIAGKIADELVDKGHDVRIVAYKYDKCNFREIKNIEVRYIFNWSFYYEKILADKLRINNSLYNKSLYFAKKVFSNVLRNCSSMGINKKTVDEIVQVLKEMNASKTIDIVLSIAAPFEFQAANYEYKKLNPDIKSILYQVDFWTTLQDRGLPGIFQDRRKKNRESLLSDMCRISQVLMIPPVKRAEGTEKIQSAQLPLIKENYHALEHHGEKTVLVYTGTLNKRERDPRALIDFLVKNDEEIELHIYHRGDCGSEIQSLSEKYPDKVFNHGTVSQKEAFAAIAGASVLLMIGTPNGNQVAGKTFDYLSTGTRILYYSQSDFDLNVDFLKNYPNLFVLRKFSEKESCSLKQFLHSNSYTDIEFSEIKSVYLDATPEFFCENYILSDRMELH